VNVAVAVIVENTRVLIIRRRAPERGLVWSFPAGKIEPGETAQEAAVREAFEETNAVTEAGPIIGERVHPDTGIHLTYVACLSLDNRHRAGESREAAEVRWVLIEEIEELMGDSLYNPVREYLGWAIGL
jgi:8-oxo-dGTP diphosphatase